MTVNSLPPPMMLQSALIGSAKIPILNVTTAVTQAVKCLAYTRAGSWRVHLDIATQSIGEFADSRLGAALSVRKPINAKSGPLASRSPRISSPIGNRGKWARPLPTAWLARSRPSQ
jgi:hypothetical protein